MTFRVVYFAYLLPPLFIVCDMLIVLGPKVTARQNVKIYLPFVPILNWFITIGQFFVSDDKLKALAILSVLTAVGLAISYAIRKL